MHPDESVSLLATLTAAYPRQELATETIEIYAHDLADLDYRVAGKAVEQLRRKSRFFPTIAEIREQYAEIVLDAPPPLTAFAQVVAYTNHRPVWVDCVSCGGRGFTDAGGDVACPTCHGDGLVDEARPALLHATVDEARRLAADSSGWRELGSRTLQKVFLDAYSEVKQRALLAIIAPLATPGLEKPRSLAGLPAGTPVLRDV